MDSIAPPPPPKAQDLLLEKVQKELQDLYKHMRSTNVRNGLKVGIHEKWCAQVQHTLKLLKNG